MSPRPKKRTTTARLDLRDPRIPGGRLVLSLRTAEKREVERRRTAILRLVRDGEWGVLGRLRAREVRVEDAVEAVERNDVARLRPAVGAGEYTLAVQCDRVLAGVTDGSRDNYEIVFKALRAHFGDEYPMERLTRSEALAWLRAPKATNGNQPWSPGRRNLVRVLCGRLWADALYAATEAAEAEDRRSVLRKNPWRDARPVRGTQEEIRAREAYLSPAQWARLHAQVAGTPRAAFYALCTLAGLRRTEALMLRPGVDVELPPGGGGRIRVQPRDGAFAWKPKTKRSVRDVPICAELRAILDAHIAAGFAGERYLIRLPGKDVPVADETPSKHWAPADFRAAGLAYGRDGDGLTIHSCRHSFASWLVQRGVDLLIVAKLLGDTVAMVERVYAHLRAMDLHNAVSVVDAAVQEGR